MRARRFAGDPSFVIFGCGDLSIQRKCGLQGHQSASGTHEVNERLVKLHGAVGVG